VSARYSRAPHVFKWYILYNTVNLERCLEDILQLPPPFFEELTAGAKSSIYFQQDNAQKIKCRPMDCSKNNT
jgi:hypothetical protein